MKISVKKYVKLFLIAFILFLLASFIIPRSFAIAGNDNILPYSNTDKMPADVLLQVKQIYEHYNETRNFQSDLRDENLKSLAKNMAETSELQTRDMLQTTGEQTSIPIYTIGDLSNISQDMSGNYILMTDLDLSIVPDWTPLVGPPHGLFEGIFEGNGHTISNLHSTRGGLFEGINGGTINSLNFIDVSINAAGVSRGAGAITSYSENGTITNCSVTGTIASSDTVGGIVATGLGTIISDCNVSATIVSNRAAGGIVGHSFGSGSFSNCVSSGTIQSTGIAGGIVGYFEIGEITRCVSSATVTAMPEGSAGGIAYGLFDGVSLSNCSATGNISGKYAGGLVMYAEAYINNCSAAGGVSGYEAGGFATKCFENTVISSCYSTGYVSATSIAGGFIGFLDEDCLISDCYTESDVILHYGSDRGQVGGFAGFCFGGVQDCKSYGYVQLHGSGYAGGMFGFCGTENTVPNQIVTRCYSYGNVTNTGDNSGGFAGQNISTVVSQCCSLGDVSGDGDYVGGFAGKDYGAITDCYAHGDVTGVDFVGGFLGYGTSPLINSYSKGRVTASGENVGGLIGNQDFTDKGGTTTSCYYDRETSGQADTGKGTPLSTWDMTHMATFTGWDFSDIWQIQEGASYPYFVDGKTISRETLGRCPYCFFGRGSINLSTGNFIFEHTDLTVPSIGPYLNFTRFYNSQDDYAGPQGKGWTNNLDIHLTLNQDNSISVAYDDGHVYTFLLDNGAYIRPPGCFETLTEGPNNGYILTFKDPDKIYF